MSVTMVERAGLREQTRFAFGRNWASFLCVLTEERIELARASLAEMLGTSDLLGKRFLDIGSGSGLFSLAARQLGATVHSFDYDSDSVACTSGLRQRFFAGDNDWTVARGSVLDPLYLASLGTFDVVYSWGVLHHTGAMYDAIDNAARLVRPGGQLCMAIYNDQGLISRIWTWEKKTYNQLPRVLQPFFGLPFQAAAEAMIIFGFVRRGNPLGYIRYWREYASQSARGMNRWHDIVDWLGGYPFEVATPAQITGFLESRGFQLSCSVLQGRKAGCNQFVFRRGQDLTVGVE